MNTFVNVSFHLIILFIASFDLLHSLLHNISKMLVHRRFHKFLYVIEILRFTDCSVLRDLIHVFETLKNCTDIC